MRQRVWVFSDVTPKPLVIKEKFVKLNCNKMKILLGLKGHHEENENTTHRVENYICKRWFLIKKKNKKLYPEYINKLYNLKNFNKKKMGGKREKQRRRKSYHL